MKVVELIAFLETLNPNLTVCSTRFSDVEDVTADDFRIGQGVRMPHGEWIRQQHTYSQPLSGHEFLVDFLILP